MASRTAAARKETPARRQYDHQDDTQAAATPKETRHLAGMTPSAALAVWLGNPTFTLITRRYPRQTGWGANKKPHPEGGTSGAVAEVIFSPPALAALLPECRLKAAIYMDEYEKDGRTHREYKPSISFFDLPRRQSPITAEAISSIKGIMQREYKAWRDRADTKHTARTAQIADTWSEDEPTEKRAADTTR